MSSYLLVLKVCQLHQHLRSGVLDVELLQDGRPVVGDGHVPNLVFCFVLGRQAIQSLGIVRTQKYQHRITWLAAHLS